MVWSHVVGCFFGGVFLANALPHLLAGVSGRSLQTPFASPPFKGLSSPGVNVLWALVNLAVAYLLLVWVGALDLRSGARIGAGFIGFSAMALQCARVFSRLRRVENPPE